MDTDAADTNATFPQASHDATDSPTPSNPGIVTTRDLTICPTPICRDAASPAAPHAPVPELSSPTPSLESPGIPRDHKPSSTQSPMLFLPPVDIHNPMLVLPLLLLPSGLYEVTYCYTTVTYWRSHNSQSLQQILACIPALRRTKQPAEQCNGGTLTSTAMLCAHENHTIYLAWIIAAVASANILLTSLPWASRDTLIAFRSTGAGSRLITVKNLLLFTCSSCMSASNRKEQTETRCNIYTIYTKFASCSTAYGGGQ